MGNWIEKNLSEVCHISIGGTPSRAVPMYWDKDSQTQNFWVSIKDMNQKLIETTSERISQKGIANSNAKLVRKGTVLLSFKLSIGKVSIAGNDLFTNEAIAALEAFGIDNQFLFHGLHKWNLLQDVDQAVKGATLNKAKLKNIKFIIPESKQEQITIATILTTIDQSIKKTEQLIAKYECIKTGLMQDLLTRGIDEEGNIRSEETHEFKDSVLGRIPKEWEVATIETFLERIIDYRGKTPRKVESGIPLITAKVVRLGYLDEPNEFIPIDDYYRWMTRGIPNTGDILFTTEAPLGNVAQVPKGKIALGQRIITLQTTNSLSSDFLFYLLLFPPIRQQLLKLSSGSTVTGIKQSQFRRIKLFVPEPQEQKKIISIMKKIDSKSVSQFQNLEKLKLLKSGLMQDLLTGKVRVDTISNTLNG